MGEVAFSVCYIDRDDCTVFENTRKFWLLVFNVIPDLTTHGPASAAPESVLGMRNAGMPGPYSDLLNQNLHFKKISRQFWAQEEALAFTLRAWGSQGREGGS